MLATDSSWLTRWATRSCSRCKIALEIENQIVKITKIKPHCLADKITDFFFRRFVFFDESVDEILSLLELICQANALI